MDDFDQHIATLRRTLERLEAHAAADDAALADAEAALAREQAVYEAAGRAWAAAQTALSGPYGTHRDADTARAEQAARAGEAAFLAAQRDLQPLLVARNDADRRRSERRGQVRFLQQQIEQLERDRDRLAAQAAQPDLGRDLLRKIRASIIGGAA